MAPTTATTTATTAPPLFLTYPPTLRNGTNLHFEACALGRGGPPPRPRQRRPRRALLALSASLPDAGHDDRSGSSASAAAAAASQVTQLMASLREEYPRMFDPAYEPDWSGYARDVLFEDPLNRFRGIERYRRNIDFLKRSFAFSDTKLVLRNVQRTTPRVGERDDDSRQGGADSRRERVQTRWTLSLRAVFLPWRPRIAFTGTSDYVLDTRSGLIQSHVDKWDSVRGRQAFFSPEALADLWQQVWRRPLDKWDGDDVLFRFREYAILRHRAAASRGTTGREDMYMAHWLRPTRRAAVPLQRGGGDGGGDGDESPCSTAMKQLRACLQRDAHIHGFEEARALNGDDVPRPGRDGDGHPRLAVVARNA